MSEINIAFNDVLPYLTQRVRFNDYNVRGYGRVPVQMGSSILWADFVCHYYTKYKQRKVFCVVEVKDCVDREVDFCIPQAESYAQRLNAPYFCCTNGKVYNWYMTGDSQGDHVPLKGAPTLPNLEFLEKPDKIYLSPLLYETIKHFETSIKKKARMYDDSKWHHDSTAELHRVIASRKLRQNKKLVLDVLKTQTMTSRGKSELLKNINNDFNKFIKIIEILEDEKIPIDVRIESCNGKNSIHGIPKAGMFFISQMLAGLFPMKYTVIQPEAANAVKRFQLADISFNADETKAYLYFNEICCEMFEHFENPFNFNLSYVHNFLWHYEKEYSKTYSWD